MSRKDSKGMFANVLGQMQSPPGTSGQTVPSQSPHLKKVADGIRQMQERGEILDRLLKEGDRIVELDADQIAQSAIQDRFEGAYDDHAMAEIIESIRMQGQIVPGLVRPSADGLKPFQIVYGRRRLAATRELGLKFKAIVKELTDEQAIIYQGEENTNRDELTFIEKCSFALAQEQAGFSRDVICASLSTGKSHISEMIRIASAIPGDVLRLIGRSPDRGRRRWMDFVELWQSSEQAEVRVRAGIGNAYSGSDRFSVAMAALETEAPAAASPNNKDHEIHADGAVIATLTRSRAGAKLSFSKTVNSGFVEFVSEKLPHLHDEYMNQIRKG